MQKPDARLTGFSLEPRLRVFSGQEMVLGGGKFMLLRLIKETGSISEAARRMDISYNHAWTLLQKMNRHFREPLVVATRGGSGKGGAILTEAGGDVLTHYAAMLEACRQAIAPQWKELRQMLVTDPGDPTPSTPPAPAAAPGKPKRFARSE